MGIILPPRRAIHHAFDRGIAPHPKRFGPPAPPPTAEADARRHTYGGSR
jgi:hypothetical protein